LTKRDQHIQKLGALLYKLIFFVPVENCESVKQAIFETQAGSLGNYANCCWQTLGEGEFIPTGFAAPHIGEINKVQKVPEYRVEILCTQENVELAVKALITHHPYEKPAFEVYEPLAKYFDFYTK